MDLLCAAKTGNFQQVKLLVEHGADVNCKNYHFGSPLHSGALSGSLEIIKYLVEHGADVNCENDCLGSPIHCAVSSGSLEIVKYLVEHGVDVTNEGGKYTVLFLACEGGNASIVDYLLQHGATKDMDNWKLKSPLRIACQKGHTSVVQTLMKYKVDIRKEKEPLICGNNEIINVLNVELKKSLKHREKIQILKGMDNVNLTKVTLYILLHAKQERNGISKSSVYGQITWCGLAPFARLIEGPTSYIYYMFFKISINMKVI